MDKQYIEGSKDIPEREPRRYRQGEDGQMHRTWNGKLPEEFSQQDALAFLADTDQKLNGVISPDTAGRFVEEYSRKIEKLVEANKNFPIEDSSIFPFEVKNGFHAAIRYATIKKSSRFETVQAAEDGVEMDVVAAIYKDGTLNEYDQGIEERKFTLKGTDAINEFSTKLERSVKDSIKAHPDIQPVVTINFSEYENYNPLVGDHMRLSLDRANSLFELIDIVAKKEASDKGRKASYRTSADIMFVQNGKIGHFDFYQDFGKSSGSIIKHIEGNMDEQIKYWSKRRDQPEGEKRFKQWETAKKELIPYFERHISLSRAERDLEYMGKAAAVMQDNIFEMRSFLNTGEIVPAPEKDQSERTQAEQGQGKQENDLPKQVDKKDKLQETMERLETGIKELFDSERYKNYLNVMSRFHDYSINNSILIAMQRPDATRVAGYNSWKDNFHRQVRKGEKGILIIQPAPYQIKKQVEKVDPQTGKAVIGADGQPVTEEANVTVMKYKTGYVFDISQTDGPELPAIGAAELTGDVKEYPLFLQAVEQVSPVPVSFEPIPGNSKGFYHQEDKRIAVKEGMGELQNIKTLIHEIAHAKLHDRDLQVGNDIDKRTKEVQAESIAYAVCQHFGLDTSDYSFAYLTSWSSGRELPELKASLETIRSTTSELIQDIEKNFAELTKAKEQAQETQLDQSENNFPTPDPNAEPVVTIIWSEHSRFHDGETMSLSKANAIIGSLDEATTKEDGYYKTRFRIDFVMDGKPDYYGGRQDLGDGDGTLIDHIEKYHTYYENNGQWDNYLLQHGGTEVLEADKAERSMLLNEFVPYLKLHENLSKMERIATQALQGNEAMTSTETAYHTAMQEYVSKCRVMINQGDYSLPPVPQLKDFDTELKAYKEHVAEEIAQEAAAAGMTVEEYAKNGYEPYTAEQPDPTIPAPDRQEHEKENEFLRQIDDVLAGKADRYSDVKVCATPELLVQAGCTQLPMFITQQHIRNIIHPKGKNPHWHGLTVQQLKKVPELLSDPVMIFDSANKRDSIVVALEETDNEKLPLIISVRPQGKGKYELSEVESNFITSIYGKDNFRNFIEKVIQEDRMLYCSKQKSQELFSVLGLQLPQGFNNLDFNKIIHLSRNIVKDRIQERSSVLGKLQQAKETAAGSGHGMDDKAKTRQHQQENSK